MWRRRFTLLVSYDLTTHIQLLTAMDSFSTFPSPSASQLAPVNALLTFHSLAAASAS